MSLNCGIASVYSHHQLLFLAQSFLAQEYNSRLEHETHGVQFQALFDLSQEVRNVQPFDPTIVQKVAGVQESNCEAYSVSCILIYFHVCT